MKHNNTPHLVLDWKSQKIDYLLILFLSLALFLYDINMNKVADLGKSYAVHITQTITFPAIALMWLAGFAIVGIIGILTFRAANNRKGHLLPDISAGIFGLVCFSFLLLGGILQVLHVETFTLFLWDVFTITAYHWIAIFGMILTMIYFVITE